MSLRISTTLLLLAIFAVLAPVRGAPTPLLNVRHEGHEDNASPAASPEKQNALDAQKLNTKFVTLKTADSCKDGEIACVNSSFAQCVTGKWALTPCAAGNVCVALPLVNKAGTTVTCDSKEEATTRFEAAGVTGGITGSDQNSGTGPTNDDDTANDHANDGGENDDDDDECDADNGNDDEANDDEDDQDCDDQDDDESPESTKLPATPTPARETVTVTVTPTIAPASTTAASSSASVGTTILLNSSAKPSSPSASAEPPAATTIKLNRRQFTGITLPASTGVATSVLLSSVTISSSPPVNTVAAPVTSTATPSVPLTSTVVAPLTTVTAEPAPTTTSARVDPTGIVIGPDGLRTVTVVSTVTVGCGASTVLPTPPASTLTLSSSPVSTTVAASSIPAVPQPVSSSASVPAPITITLKSPAPASSASSIASSSPSANTIVSPTATTVGGGTGGFSFSTAPSPTAAPGNVNIGDANNGAASPTVDLSKLLTATIGSL